MGLLTSSDGVLYGVLQEVHNNNIVIEKNNNVSTERRRIFAFSFFLFSREEMRDVVVFLGCRIPFPLSRSRKKQQLWLL